MIIFQTKLRVIKFYNNYTIMKKVTNSTTVDFWKNSKIVTKCMDQVTEVTQWTA